MAVSWTTFALAFSKYDLSPFDWKSVEIPMHRGVCSFHKASQDVQDFSRFAIDRLVQVAELNKRDCSPLYNDALVIRDNMQRYFDRVYYDKGIAKDDGDTVMRLNCNNAEEVFRLQLYNYRLYATRGRELEDPVNNIFYGKCLDETTRGIKPEVENLDQCLKDVMAEALHDFNENCKGEQHSIRDEIVSWRRRIQTQEVALVGAQQAMQRIFALAQSERCNQTQDLAKAAIQSAITIGANVAGTAFGGTLGAVGASIGAQAINFMVDYLFKLTNKKNAIEQVVSEKNYENAACMWISLQEKLCQQYSIIPPEPITKKTCGLRDSEKPVPVIELLDEFSSLASYTSLGEDEQGNPTAEPAHYEALKDLIQLSYEQQKELVDPAADAKVASEADPFDFDADLSVSVEPKPVPQKKTIKQILEDSKAFFKKQTNKEDYNRILKANEVLEQGRILLKEYDTLNSKETDARSIALRKAAINKLFIINDKIKTEKLAKEELLKQMGKSLQGISQLDISKLIENYLTFAIKKQEGLDQILAEEMSVEIYNSFETKLETYLDDLDGLQDINNAATEIFKPVFSSKLWYRYQVNLQNAQQMEKSHLRVGNLIESEAKRRRLATFAQLRDTIKDCLSVQGIFFSRRKARSLIMSYIIPPPKAANLDIDRVPTRYLKACAPFMCKEGIPIPHLPNKNEAPIHFQQYSCNILNDSEAIIRKLRTNYIEKGTICGKTIHEITTGLTRYSMFGPLYRSVKSLKQIIKSPMIRKDLGLFEYQQQQKRPQTQKKDQRKDQKKDQ